jgi:hypothetical protein
MTNVEKFRPGGAIASGWLLTFFFGGFIVQTIFYGGDFVLTTAICGAGIIAAYLLFLKPYVLIFDEGIQIINPTKEITATWDLVEEIETKFSMSITVDGAQYFAWAAPAPGHRHSRRMHKTDLLPGSDAPRRLGDSPQSDSGACSYIAKLRRKAFVKNNPSNFELRSDSRLIYLIYALILVALVSIFI